MPHSIRFHTKRLADGELLFESMTHTSGLSTLGETQLTLLSHSSDVAPEDLLGYPVRVSVRLRDDAERHFHGYVTRLGLGVQRGRLYGYQATVQPWLWFLTRRTDCRIFQNQTVPDIVKAVFEGHRIADFKFKLFREYREWVYCVQYRESDFNFAMRLLEHEGIYWYFEHSSDRHTLVLVDSASAHDSEPGCESLPYLEHQDGAPLDYDHVERWSFLRRVKTGKVVLKDYDFERPSVEPIADATYRRQHDMSDYELFDYPGMFVKGADGQQYAQDRMDEIQATFEVYRGTSNAYGLHAGRLLKLTRHPREDQNAEYLLTQITVTASIDGYEAATGTAVTQGPGFECEFTALPSRQQFRPRRRTPKPVMQGPQTARVVGPSGIDIHTDKYGRIKVQFYWDRYGKRDNASSCWIRVSQNWGGKGWGGMFIPHVGQEVIVEFLEGDPDQPLVTGRVYNAENMPPVALPAGKTVSVISDHGGNSIKMEGNAGSQQIKMFSPTGNTTFAIGAPNSPGDGIEGVTDRFFTMTVGMDWKETIKGMKSTDIKLDEETKVQGNSTKLILGNSSETLWGHKDSAIKGYKTESILGFERKVVLGFSSSYIGLTKTDFVVGMETKTNIGVKNDIIMALNNKLTKGGLVDINNAKVLLKCPIVFENVFDVIKREKKESKEVNDYALKVQGVMKEKIAELTQAIGRLNTKIDGAYTLETGGKMLFSPRGNLYVEADSANFSGELNVEKDMSCSGGTMKFGTSFIAKK